MKIVPIVALCMLLLSGSAHALQKINKSELDSRITKAVYHADEVFPVEAISGRATLITFQKGESVLSWASGYSTAWEFSSTQNHFFLKPKAEHGNTNLVVLTNKRTYHFDLRWGKQQSAVTYELRFSYPENDRQANPKGAKEQEGVSSRAGSKEELFFTKLANRNYTMNFGDARDSRQLAPEMAFDDGRFTYLKIPLKSAMPAVYRVSGGEELLVNTHIEGNWLVIHGVYSEIRLRDGARVCGIYNDRFRNQSLYETESKVTVDGFQRALKQSES